MPAGAKLRVNDIVEADNTRILCFLLNRTLERNGGRGRNGRRDFLLRSDADFLVPLPVGCLVILGAVAGIEATGAGIHGRDLAVRKGAVGGGFGCSRGIGWRLARIHFWGRLVCVEGIEGGLLY